MIHRIASVAACAALVATLSVASHAVLSAQTDRQAEVLLQAAREKQQVEGKLEEAIKIYQQIVSKHAGNRPAVARATYEMGECYEKLGVAQAQAARSAYERILAQYADQTDVAAQARVRLAGLTKPATGSTSGGGTVKRLLYEGQTDGLLRPSISADGRYLAAVLLGGQALFVRNLASGEQHRIVPTGLPEQRWIVRGVVSPDGRQVAYTLAGRSTGPEVPAGQVQIAAIDGTAARVVLKQPGRFVVTEWAGDGTRLLGWSQAATANAPAHFVSIAVNGGAVTTIVSVPAPANIWASALSPDGRWIACTESRATTEDIFLIDTKTGGRSWVTDPAAKQDNMQPVWAPDGRGLLFVRETEGTRSLWFQRLNEGRPDGQAKMLRANIDDIGWPARATADGTLYCVTSRFGFLDTSFKTYTVRLDPASGKIGQKPTVMTGLDFACGWDWSPDSTAIIYGAHVNQARGACTLLAIRPVGGGRDRFVDPGMSGIRRPRWSPDGKSALVGGVKDGTAGIYSVDLGTGAAKLLVADQAPRTFGDMTDLWMAPYWAPDGKGFYFQRHEQNKCSLVYRDLETGKETERFAGMFSASQMTVGRDGSVSLLAEGKVIVVPAVGSAARTVHSATAPAWISSTCWTADGKGIWATQGAATADEPRLSRLIRIPLDGGPPSDGGLQMAGLDNPRPSPDGKWLMFQASTVPPDQVWAIEHFLPARTAGKRP